MKVRKNRGFTLIELFIVIALIAIVAAIASANFKTYRDKTNLREVAREISSDIQLYKQRAVAENVAYSIDFDAGGNNYTIQRDGVNVVTKKVGKDKVPVSIDGTPAFGADTTLSLSRRGTTEAGSLTLKHASPKLKRIRITTSMMGRVTVNFI